MEIKTLDGSEPHKSWGGWENFLKSCELRDKYAGVKFYGKTNCNYILFPTGLLIKNYGWCGAALMTEIRQRGLETIMAELQELEWEYGAIR